MLGLNDCSTVQTGLLKWRNSAASIKKDSKGDMNLVGTLPVFCSEIALHGSRLRHLQSLHAVVVKTEDLGALEPHNKPLQPQAAFLKVFQRRSCQNFVSVRKLTKT